MTDIKELKDEELKQVSGGNESDAADNPKGLKPGDDVYFYWTDVSQWMWGTFLYYYSGQYRVKWNDTQLMYGTTGISLLVKADEDSIPEEYIKLNAN